MSLLLLLPAVLNALAAAPSGTSDPFSAAPFLLLDEEAFVLTPDGGTVYNDVFLPNVAVRDDGSRSWSERLDDGRTTWTSNPPLNDGKVGDGAVLLRNHKNEAFLASVWEGAWLTLALAPVDQGGIKGESARKVLSSRHYTNSKVVAVAGDLDGDRATELVVGYRWDTGYGTTFQPHFVVASVADFDRPVESEFPDLPKVHGSSGLRIAAGDVDGDGKDEIAALYVSSDGAFVVALFRGGTDGRLRLLGSTTLDLVPYSTQYGPDRFDLAIADWEGDGKGKIFCVTGGGSDGFGRHVRLLSVNLQGETVAFTTESRHSQRFFSSMSQDGPVLAAAADLSGNGKDELLLTSTGLDDVFRRTELIAIYNKGDGTSGVATKSWDTLRIPIYSPIEHLKTGRFTGSLNPSARGKNRSHALVLFGQTSGMGSGDGYHAHLLRLDGADFKEVSSVQLGRHWVNPAHLLVGDLDRDSMVLGNPTHIVLENQVTPLLFMNEPPKHVDVDRSGDVTNRTRRDDLYVRYTQGASQTGETTNILETESNLGGALTLEQKGGVNLGLVEAEAKLTTTVGASTKDLNSEINRSYGSRSTTLTGATTRDDLLLYISNTVHLWRYPILGWMSEPEGGGARLPTYYQISIPEAEGRMNFLPGLNTDWYHPAHMNGNVLSYPSGTEQIPDYADDRRLSERIRFAVGGGTASEQGIEWKDGSTRESLKSVTNTLELDVEMQASGSAKVRIFEVGGSTTAAFHMDKRTTETHVGKTSVEKQTAFSVHIPAFSEPFGHQATPLMYKTNGGVLKTAHVVDGLNTPSLWEEQYASAPDPALNLPRLWRYVEGKGWTWAAEDPLNPDARKIRGIFFKDDQGVDLGTFLPRGGEVKVDVRVHNLSLADCGGPFDVRFLFGPKGGTLKDATEIGSASMTSPISRWGVPTDPNWKWASVVWDTAAMNVSEGYYRVWVVVNPGKSIPELSQRGQGEAFDNNVGWYDVTVGRTRADAAEDLASEGRTADLETNNLVAVKLEVENRPADGVVFRPGEEVLLRATLRNEGLLPVGQISVLFYDGDPDRGGRPFANRIVSGLLPWDTQWVEQPHDFDTPGSRVVYVRIVPKSDDPIEDNTASVPVQVRGEGPGGGSGGCSFTDAGAGSLLLLLGLLSVRRWRP